MSFSGPGFVIAIIAITTLGWIITTAIRAKHGYPLTDDWGNTVEPKPREDGKLAQENAELRATVSKLEDRLKVLERIATDPAKRLSDDIERLRD